MKNRIQIHVNTMLHYNMALIGGFIGVYALLLRGGNFGSAQTGNLMEMMISLSKRDITEVIIRLGAAVVYGLFLILSYILTKYTKKDMRKLVLKVESIGLLFSVFIPESIHPVVALYPIFAIMSFQWGTYAGTNGYNSASVFMTNNFKQTVLSWTQFCLEHDKKAKDKAIFYTFTVLSFLIGALVSSIFVSVFGIYAALLCFIPLGTARLLLFLEKHE